MLNYHHKQTNYSANIPPYSLDYSIKHPLYICPYVLQMLGTDAVTAPYSAMLDQVYESKEVIRFETANKVHTEKVEIFALYIFSRYSHFSNIWENIFYHAIYSQ